MQALGAGDGTEDFRLGGGIGVANEVEDNVSDIIVSLGAGSGGAAQSMGRIGLRDAIAACLAHMGLI